MIAGLLALIVGAFIPSPALAKPEPGYKPASGFRLFARSSFRWVGNRVQCFLSSTGQICSAESSVLGGGYWPAGTGNQYMFNTGLQVAGIVDPNSAGNSWAGDIEGAYFFNARGGGNGQQITQIYNSADPDDLRAWPVEAHVPCDPATPGVTPELTANCTGTDASSTLYNPALQGKKTAASNDIWFLSWEGDPNLAGGRGHPLGLLVETRGLAYTAPGKDDFLFFLYTFYNVTARNPAVYNNAPPRLQAQLRNAGVRFQDLNEAKGATLPDDGYTIQDMFLAFGADMDVTSEDAGANYDGVNVPFALGYTYHHTFTAPTSWTFTDATIYRPPFYAAAGFIGVKYLKSPEVGGVEVGLTLFGATTNGGEFSDPRNTQALYRYLTGHPDPSQGDDQCNVGDPAVTKICYLNQGAAADMRFFQSSGPLTLAPGEYSSIAVAYVLAAPVATGACVTANSCGSVPPQRPTNILTRLTDPILLTAGANLVDSITGFRGWSDVNGDNIVQQGEFTVVPGSLLGKSLAAQAIFDGRFVSPVPPIAPDYFLIPGDNQVTVVWRPSISEQNGDPYFSAAQSPATYDPNYRQYDVAGYRVYRGDRADASSLRLLAQFDISGDLMTDRTGQLNQINAQGLTECAPVNGVFVSCTDAGVVNGVPTITPITVSLDAPLTQNQVTTTTGTGNTVAVVQQADTALTGGGTGRPALSGTGVPFIFVDRTGNCNGCGVRNHTRYFYIVSAFDINSIRSGPSSLESNLSGARAVTPTPAPTNISTTGTVAPVEVLNAAGQTLTDNVVPTIHPTNGTFSKPFPPADGSSLALAAFLPEVLPSTGGVRLRLDDIELGSSYSGAPITYHWKVFAGTDSVDLVTSLVQDPTFEEAHASALYEAVPLDNTNAGKYGGSDQFKLLGRLDQTVIGSYYSGGWGRGCVNGADGFVPGPGQAGCDYNGPRWFLGPSPANPETQANPIAGNGDNFNPGAVDNSAVVNGIPNGGFNNAGALPNVEVIHQVIGYQTVGNQWRDFEGLLSGGKRAADYNVYWSATTPGLIDRVEDVTHGVEVDFDSLRMGPTYGLLTSALAQPSGAGQTLDARAELSIVDFGCVEPARSLGTVGGQGPGRSAPCGGTGAGGDGPTYTMTRQAAIGPIVHFSGSPANSAVSTNTGQGFAMYIAGNVFMFQTTTLPTNTVWSMRDYVGAITGGNGFGGNDGDYAFAAVPRPFAAVGASLRLGFSASSTPLAVRARDIRRVHTVPDPYYVTNSLEASSDQKIIKFVNLPDKALIRIYSVSGVLVRVLEHNSATSNEEVWDVRNRNGQFVASGVYFWHIEAGDARRVGRMTIVNFAK
jgi:hypothetical protein